MKTRTRRASLLSCFIACLCGIGMLAIAGEASAASDFNFSDNPQDYRVLENLDTQDVVFYAPVRSIVQGHPLDRATFVPHIQKAGNVSIQYMDLTLPGFVSVNVTCDMPFAAEVMRCVLPASEGPKVVNRKYALKARNLDGSDCCESPYMDAVLTYGIDKDRDAIPDDSDNCASVRNFSQADGNKNGLGDACDLTKAIQPINGKIDFQASKDAGDAETPLPGSGESATDTGATTGPGTEESPVDSGTAALPGTISGTGTGGSAEAEAGACSMVGSGAANPFALLFALSALALMARRTRRQ